MVTVLWPRTTVPRAVQYCDHELRFPGRYSTVPRTTVPRAVQYCDHELRFPGRYSTVTTDYGSQGGTVVWPRTTVPRAVQYCDHWELRFPGRYSTVTTNYGSQGGTVLWPRTTVPRAVQYCDHGTTVPRAVQYCDHELRFPGRYSTVTTDYGSQGGTVQWPRTTVPRAVQYSDHELRFPGRYSTVTTDYGSQGSQYSVPPWERSPWYTVLYRPGTTVPRAVQYCDHGLRFPGRYSTVTTNYGSQGGTVQWPRTTVPRAVQYCDRTGNRTVPRAVQYSDHELRFPGRYSTVTPGNYGSQGGTVLWPRTTVPRAVPVLWTSPWSHCTVRPLGTTVPRAVQYSTTNYGSQGGTVLWPRTTVPRAVQYCTALGTVVRGHSTVPPWEPYGSQGSLYSTALGTVVRGHCTVPPWELRFPGRYSTVTTNYGSQGGTVLWPRTTVPRAVQYSDHGTTVPRAVQYCDHWELRFPGRYSTVTTNYGSQGGTVQWPRTTVPRAVQYSTALGTVVRGHGTVLWPRTTVPRAVQYSDHGLRFRGHCTVPPWEP